MAEGEEHQSGSWLGDLTHEWKTAKPPEKAFIVIAILAVAGIAYYVYTKNQGAATSTRNAPGASTAGTTGATTNGTSGGIPTIPQGSTPILPSGYSPIYDASGNVVGYEQNATGNQPAPATSTTPTAGTLPASVPTPSTPLTPAQAQQTGQLLPTSSKPVSLSSLPAGGSFTNLGNGLYQVVGGNTQYGIGTLLQIGKSTPAVFGQTKIPSPTPQTQVMRVASRQATPQPVGSNAQTTASKLAVSQAGNLPAGGPH